jgi:hypothetical protein
MLNHRVALAQSKSDVSDFDHLKSAELG